MERQNPFSKCKECIYHDDLPIDHEFNTRYKRDLDKVEALKDSGFPTEVAIKIVEMTYSYFDCDFCLDNVICKYHKDKMLFYGKYDFNIICEECYKDSVEFVQH